MVVRQALSDPIELSLVFNHYHLPVAANPSYLSAVEAGDPRLTAAERGRPGPGPAAGPSLPGHDRRRAELGRIGGADTGRADSRAPLLGRAGPARHRLGRPPARRHRPRHPLVVGATAHRGPLNLDQRELVASAAPFGQLSVSPHPRVTPDGRGPLPLSRPGGGPETRRRRSVGPPHHERAQPQHRHDRGGCAGPQRLRQPGDRLRDAHRRARAVAGRIGAGSIPELAPSRLRSFELAVRGLIEPVRLRYEVAAYRSRLLDRIVPVRSRDFALHYDNAGETARDGVDVSLGWRPPARFEARFAYTLQNFIFRRFVLEGVDYAGKREPGAPPRRVFAGVDYAAPFRLQASASVRWVDEYFFTLARIIPGTADAVTLPWARRGSVVRLATAPGRRV